MEFVQISVDNIESGIGAMALVTAEDFIIAAWTCYRNMDHRDLWDKVDPCNTQIMALMTQLKALKDQQRKYNITLATNIKHP